MIKSGTVIFAHPELNDPDLERAVIVIVSMANKGMVGLNIASLRSEPGPTGQIYLGGPVTPEGEMYVIRPLRANGDAAHRIAGSNYEFRFHNVAGTTPQGDLLHTNSDQHMVFIGYAGWLAGYLEAEMADGNWQISSVSLDELMAVPVAQRWKLASKMSLE